MEKCWCGNYVLNNYSDDYFKCESCQTLVSKVLFREDVDEVSDEENDLYGKNYWEKTMVKEAGVESLDEIIDMYLCERVPYWLKYILRYCPLNGKVAEVGCGLGQLAYLMKRLGYNQLAYELSPYICEYVHDRLGVNMVNALFGEIDEKYDTVLAFDVFEHLLKPEEFLKQCTEHLSEKGILCLQTPCYDEKLTYEQMCQLKPHFKNLLVKDQHIYLFSRESIETILRSAGFEYIEFEQAYFGDDYDMFLFASRQPIKKNTDTEIDDFLNNAVNGRLVKAMISLVDMKRELLLRLQDAETNSKERLKQVDELTAMLKESEADRAARLEQINTLTAMLKENDSSAKQKEINNLAAMLKEKEKDGDARLEQINSLTAMLKESEADRAARLEQINSLTELLKESEADRAAKLEQVNVLTEKLNLIYKIKKK